MSETMDSTKWGERFKWRERLEGSVGRKGRGEITNTKDV